jgi:predicted HTH transcriptional regulator
LDWKNSLSNNRAPLSEHLIAFANHPNGSCLVYGITNSNGELVGVTQEKVTSIITSLTNLGRDAIEPPLILDHSIIEIEDVPILFIRIPEQPNKPAHRRGKSIEETWIRSCGSTRKASRQEIGELLLHSKQPCWEELRASSLLQPDEILRLLNLKTIGELLERPTPQDQTTSIQWLVEEKMVTPDGNGYYITNLGAIAAAHDLNQFNSLARKQIRLMRYKGNNKINTIDEKMENIGYAVGLESLIAYLNSILPHSKIIQQALRTQATIYPEIALRELIANTIIHQDFNVTDVDPHC